MFKRLPLLLASILLGFLAIQGLVRATRAQASIPSAPPVTQAGDAWITKIQPSLLKQILHAQASQRFDVILEWKRDFTLYQQAQETLYLNKTDRRIGVAASLQQDAQIHSAGIVQALANAVRNGSAGNVRPFWVSPVIAFQTAPDLILTLAQRPDVAQIRLDAVIKLEDDQFRRALESTSSSWQFNLDMIDVDQAQNLLGLDGSGVVVANIDTGVDWQHPALLPHYRGYNPHGPANHVGNWYVATGETYQYPGDGYGHGTHTMGTMVGDDGSINRTGVAPGAQWIAVKAFTNQGYTTESWLHASFQWIMAPNGDPSLAPDIVNNSWGSSNGADTTFRSDVAALRAAGIFPVFSAGNNGPDVDTVSSPGSFPESVAVGALDPDKLVASFSSRGPSAWSEVKPEISAPGVDIRSTYPGGGYYLANGTSMAAPHVAGVAALLLQADPDLTPDQLEQILKSTSEPLGSPIPNNNTGWGMVNAFSAALNVVQHGILSGTVTRNPGAGIADPTLIANNLNPGYTQTITASGDDLGQFELALLPGRYTVTATAFGYFSETISGLDIFTGTTTNTDFHLDELPKASLHGVVLDSQTSLPLSATLSVDNTPYSGQSDPSTGSYSLSLPAGTWPVTIRSDAHRVGHITPTVTVPGDYPVDIALDPAPTILLVDSGRWDYASRIQYYEQALIDLNFDYDLWPIVSPYGYNGLPDDRPTTSTLRAYDVVIWSSPDDSPGLLGMNDVITDYLSSGGNFLVSGQDVAYLDGGGFNLLVFPQPYLTDWLGIRFQDEGNLASLTGVSGSALDGLNVQLNPTDSAQQQSTPDAITIRFPRVTSANLEWSDQTIGGIQAGTCQPYKAAWLGFGIEGSGPEATRRQLLDRLITWLSSPPASYGMYSTGGGTQSISTPGTAVTHTFQLFNTGAENDTFSIQLNSTNWPASFQLSNGQVISDSGSIDLTGCTSTTLTTTLQIPPSALRNEGSDLTLLVTSQQSSSITSTLTLSVKTPAPLLIVDDQRWYDYFDRYSTPLDELGLPYDRYTTGGSNSVPTSTLREYPLVLWMTGYDWFLPLSQTDENHLSDYLAQDHGLLLTSQDLLDIRGVDPFVQDKLGVSTAELSTSPAEADVIASNNLDIPSQKWSLAYPYQNFSDGLTPDANTEVLLKDYKANTIGLLHPTSGARSAFLSFPLEALSAEGRFTLFSKIMLWLSNFGDSHLAVPAAASAGEQIAVHLRIESTAAGAMSDLKVEVPLPANTTFVTGSLSGDWSYDVLSTTLRWQGSLDPHEPVELAAQVQLDLGLADGITIPFKAYFYDPAGLQTITQSDLRIGQASIELNKEWTPAIGQPGDVAAFTITLTNTGVAPGSLRMTETLEDGLSLLTSSLTGTNGSFSLTTDGFLFSDTIDPLNTASISYQALVTQPQPGGSLFSRSELTYLDQNRLGLALINLPAIFYFPIIQHGAP